jgi:hypothetical protein
MGMDYIFADIMTMPDRDAFVHCAQIVYPVRASNGWVLMFQMGDPQAIFFHEGVKIYSAERDERVIKHKESEFIFRKYQDYTLCHELLSVRSLRICDSGQFGKHSSMIVLDKGPKGDQLGIYKWVKRGQALWNLCPTEVRLAYCPHSPLGDLPRLEYATDRIHMNNATVLSACVPPKDIDAVIRDHVDCHHIELVHNTVPEFIMDLPCLNNEVFHRMALASGKTTMKEKYVYAMCKAVLLGYKVIMNASLVKQASMAGVTVVLYAIAGIPGMVLINNVSNDILTDTQLGLVLEWMGLPLSGVMNNHNKCHLRIGDPYVTTMWMPNSSWTTWTRGEGHAAAFRSMFDYPQLRFRGAFGSGRLLGTEVIRFVGSTEIVLASWD